MFHGTGGLLPGEGTGLSLDGMPNTSGQEHERQWRFTRDVLDFMNAGKTNAEDYGGRSGFEMQKGESIASLWGGPLHGADAYSNPGSFEQKAPLSEYGGQGLLNFRTPHSGPNWNFNMTIGSHSALYIPGKGILYDPGGSYGGMERPSGDTFYAAEANLDNYIKYHEAGGSKVYLTTLPTTPSQEDEIAARVGTLGGRGTCSCASSVSEALGGVCEAPIFSLPGLLHDKAEKAAHAK